MHAWKKPKTLVKFFLHPLSSSAATPAKRQSLLNPGNPGSQNPLSGILVAFLIGTANPKP